MSHIIKKVTIIMGIVMFLLVGILAFLISGYKKHSTTTYTKPIQKVAQQEINDMCTAEPFLQNRSDNPGENLFFLGTGYSNVRRILLVEYNIVSNTIVNQCIAYIDHPIGSSSYNSNAFSLAVQADYNSGDIFYMANHGFNYDESGGADMHNPYDSTTCHDFNDDGSCTYGNLYMDNIFGHNKDVVVFQKSSGFANWMYNHNNKKLYIAEQSNIKALTTNYYEVDPHTLEKNFLGTVTTEPGISPNGDIFFNEKGQLVHMYSGSSFKGELYPLNIYTFDIENKTMTLDTVTIPNHASDFKISPDHTKIFYNRWFPPGKYEMYVYDLVTKKESWIQLEEGWGYSNYNLTWSSDSRGLYMTLTHTLETGDRKYGLGYFDIDTQKIKMIFEDTDLSWRIDSLSPSGTYLITRNFPIYIGAKFVDGRYVSVDAKIPKREVIPEFMYVNTKTQVLSPMTNFLSDTYGFKKIFEQNFDWIPVK